MTLLARESRPFRALRRRTVRQPAARTIPRDTLVTVCELEFHPDKETDDVLNERRRSVVNSVHSIVAHEKTDGGWGQAVEFHVASAIVMMMELEKRARQVALTFLPASIAVGMLSLYFSFRTWPRWPWPCWAARWPFCWCWAGWGPVAARSAS